MEEDMRKIKIFPWNGKIFDRLACLAMLTWIAFTAGILMLVYGKYKITGALLMILGILGTGIEASIALNVRKGREIFYNEKQVKWTSFGKEHTIELSDVKEIVYYVMENRTGGVKTGRQTIRRMEVCFLTNVGKPKLKALHVGDKISLEDLKKIKKGNKPDLPIMEFYRFYEKTYPNRAKGIQDLGELRKKIILW